MEIPKVTKEDINENIRKVRKGEALTKPLVLLDGRFKKEFEKQCKPRKRYFKKYRKRDYVKERERKYALNYYYEHREEMRKYKKDYNKRPEVIERRKELKKKYKKQRR